MGCFADAPQVNIVEPTTPIDAMIEPDRFASGQNDAIVPKDMALLLDAVSIPLDAQVNDAFPPMDQNVPDQGIDMGIPEPSPAPVITEIMGRNHRIIRDENGDESDWIELFNPHPEPIDLANYSLTNDPAFPRRWIFPARVISPGEYLVIFASGEDRRNPMESLHASFTRETLPDTSPFPARMA